MPGADHYDTVCKQCLPARIVRADMNKDDFGSSVVTTDDSSSTEGEGASIRGVELVLATER